MGRENEQKMLVELNELGFQYADVNDIFKQDLLAPEVVEIILKWLPIIYKGHLGAGDLLTRSLLSAKKPFNPQSLIDFFEANIYNSSVMWAVAHVISTSNSTDISTWIHDQLINQPGTFERSGLLTGIVKKGNFKNVDDFMDFMKKIFDKYIIYEQFRLLYKKYAQLKDIDFLQEKLDGLDQKTVKEVQKLIIAISKKVKFRDSL